MNLSGCSVYVASLQHKVSKPHDHTRSGSSIIICPCSRACPANSVESPKRDSPSVAAPLCALVLCRCWRGMEKRLAVLRVTDHPEVSTQHTHHWPERHTPLNR